jgi:hypothetical protein
MDGDDLSLLLIRSTVQRKEHNRCTVCSRCSNPLLITVRQREDWKGHAGPRAEVQSRLDTD